MTTPGTIAFSAVLAAFSLTVSAQSGSFNVDQHGHQVGTAEFHITPSASGFESNSIVQVHMQGLDYSLSKSEQLDTARHIQHVQVSATVNGSAVRLTGKPDPSGFLLNVSANGRASTSRLASHASAVFLPDFDPGALETLLMLAVAHNGRDLWAIIPKQAGSVSTVQIATLPDEQGTLAGKPIAVHHLEVTISGAPSELFTGPDNQLLQAELQQEGFALVRKGFVLTPPRRPLAAPDQPVQQQPQQPAPTQPQLH